MRKRDRRTARRQREHQRQQLDHLTPIAVDGGETVDDIVRALQRTTEPT